MYSIIHTHICTDIYIFIYIYMYICVSKSVAIWLKQETLIKLFQCTCQLRWAGCLVPRDASQRQHRSAAGERARCGSALRWQPTAYPASSWWLCRTGEVETRCDLGATSCRSVAQKQRAGPLFGWWESLLWATQAYNWTKEIITFKKKINIKSKRK